MNTWSMIHEVFHLTYKKLVPITKNSNLTIIIWLERAIDVHIFYIYSDMYMYTFK